VMDVGDHHAAQDFHALELLGAHRDEVHGRRFERLAQKRTSVFGTNRTLLTGSYSKCQSCLEVSGSPLLRNVRCAGVQYECALGSISRLSHVTGPMAAARRWLPELKLDVGWKGVAISTDVRVDGHTAGASHRSRSRTDPRIEAHRRSRSIESAVHARDSLATSRLPPDLRSITALTATMIEDADMRRAETSGRSDQPHSG
jgi:hypothetical protein